MEQALNNSNVLNEPVKNGTPPISRNEAMVFLLSGIVFAVLYTFCFSGIEILPHLSFALFCPAVFIGLTAMLRHLGYYKNKKAIIWAVPIIIASAFNYIFSTSVFTYGNVILMHVMFAAYIACAMREQSVDLFGLDGLKMILRIIGGNFFLIFNIRKTFVNTKQEVKGMGTFLKIFIGVLLAVPFLLLITSLLLSADMVFDKIVGDIIYKIFDNGVIDIPLILTFVIALAYAAGYAYQGKKVADSDSRVNIRSPKVDVVIGATFLVLINLLFLLFTFIQVAYLFGGGFMELPEGMIYSQYAREGFFQLLFVTVINFSVIFVFMSFLSGVGDSKPLRFLLLSLCFFTAVLIASSFYRMYLYIGVYGHTPLRLCVITFLTMEVFLIAVTVCKLFNDKIRYVKLFIMTTVIFYFIVNFTGSDYLAARLNVSGFLSGKLDYIDARSVGQDGLNVIKPLFEDERYICFNEKIINKSDISKYAGTSAEDMFQTYEHIASYVFITQDYWQNKTFFGSR